MLDSTRTACEFCCVTFQIGRIRTALEPQSAAWTRDGDGYVDGFQVCRREVHGCIASASLKEDEIERDGVKLDTAIDKDWAENFLTETLLDMNSATRTDLAGVSIGCASWRHSAATYLQKIAADLARDYTIEGIGDIADDSSDSSSDSWSRDDRKDEHIAGPDCQDRDGYNGNKISVEEMKYCNTLQCLVDKRITPKPTIISRAKLQPGDSDFEDEPFERDGKHFLSGLVEKPGALVNFTTTPTRRGVSDPWVSNDAAAHNLTVCMPFHPHCFEIFRRVSRSRDARIGPDELDIDTLMAWWRAVERPNPFGRLSGSAWSTLSSCLSMWDGWQHRSGTEFLAADPLFPKGLQALFGRVTRKDDRLDIDSGVFNVPARRISSKTDVLSKLPNELRHIVLAQLDVMDVANLRLASRSFQQLPNWYFRHLLQKEQPWIWEALRPAEQTPHLKWATATAKELHEWERYSDYMARNIASKLLNERSSLPGLSLVFNAHTSNKDELTRRLKSALKGDDLTPGASARRHPFSLLHDQTDWYQLYMLLKKQALDILGLRNRRRIWKNCEEMLNQIDEFRKGQTSSSTRSPEA